MGFVIFSGLPASGKSSLARQLAPALGLPLLDKDDFLDALFEERGIGDLTWRSALSRDADVRFVAAARQMSCGCLVSWWRHPAVATASGTPVDWLASLARPLVEVHCQCDVETAAKRFGARSRHAGHLDSDRGLDELRSQLGAAPAQPLECGFVISVDTMRPIDIPSLVERVRLALHVQ